MTLTCFPLDTTPSQLPQRHYRYAVGGIVLRYGPSPRILLIKRAAHERTFANSWEHAGGRLEKDDATLFAALQRELLEETGLKIKSVVANLSDARFGQRLQNTQLNYIVDVENDENVVLTPDEHSEYLWAGCTDLQDLDMTEEKRAVARAALVFAQLCD